MLKTRINAQSDNDSIIIRGKDGEELAFIQAVGDKSITLNIETAEGLYIEKPTGWKSEVQKGLDHDYG